MVSSNNLAFNLSGEPASISRTNTLFDLNSAYLTAAFQDGLQVRVQGFSGPTLAYDNTYTLNTTGPVLVHFNYTNVDLVKFFPSPANPFAMDNLEVAIHDTPIPHASVDVGQVETSTIGHRISRTPGGNYRVADLLIDQEQISSSGGVLPSVSINWDNYDQLVLKVSAPTGHKFQVQPPAGHTVYFGGGLTWESTGGGSAQPGSASASLDGLEGTDPGLTPNYSFLSVNHSFFGFGNLTSSPVTNNLAFTSITLMGTVVAQHTGLGTLDFTPHINSSLSLGYTTPETNDPGRFVFIVPVTPAPRISITTVSQEAGVMLSVQGQAGRTNVVQSSEDLVNWTPISTNVMPATLCPVCPYVDVSDATATNSARRFYRALELP